MRGECGPTDVKDVNLGHRSATYIICIPPRSHNVEQTGYGSHLLPLLQATELARALRNLPQELKNYKTIAAFQDQALEYLDGIGSQTEAKLPEPVMQ